MIAGLLMIGVANAGPVPLAAHPEQVMAAIESQLAPLLAADEGRESRWSIDFEAMGKIWRWSETEAGANGTDHYVYEVAPEELNLPPAIISLAGGGYRLRLECRSKPCIHVRGTRAASPVDEQRRSNHWPIADEAVGHRVQELLTSSDAGI